MKLLLGILQHDSSPANDSRHPAIERRVAAAFAIGGLGREARGAVEALVTALRDGNPYLRNAAADALGKIGPNAEAAIPALEEAMWCDDIMVSQAAKEALARIRGGDARH
jgi:HEAT repeat protein